jgi:hypothetical protein
VFFDQLTSAWQLLRPRTIAQTRKHVTDLRDDVRSLSEEVRELQRMLSNEIARVGASVNKLANREAQLRAVAVREIELEGRADELERIIADPAAAAHVRQRVSDAALKLHPFPHLVVDQLLPKPLYEALITGLPPVEMFNDHPPNKQQLTVPFKLAPWYTRRIWTHMVHELVPRILTPALRDRFREILDSWIDDQFPGAGTGVDGLEMVPSDGRILLRTRGYVIRPHRDPKWGFITCILYLARHGDSPAWGTQLYEVDGDEEARGALPHWIQGRECRQVKDVPFVANRALVFLNSVGAHGASIPPDAPEGLERYIYQFRIGPSADAMAMLMNSLPEDRRAFWAGKLSDY